MDQDKKADIQNRLAIIEKKPFPEGIRSKQFSGKSITVLQSEILSGVQSIVVTDGRMATRLRILLDKNLEILAAAIQELDAGAVEYFKDIQAVAIEARACCVECL